MRISIALIAILGVFGCTGVPNEPRIRFDETEHNFSEIPSQSVSHTFRFGNVGGDTLKIEKVRAP